MAKSDKSIHNICLASIKRYTGNLTKQKCSRVGFILITMLNKKMSAYNLLISEVSCLNCYRQYPGRIQFKFGSTAYLQYHIGDKIQWGVNDTGTSGLNKVKVYGIVETDKCPLCNSNNIVEDFDIFINNDIILNVKEMENVECYLKEGNSEYVVLER
ncbi:hypothetical protein [Chitinophaga pinensis]|uniref:Uncharacterized protein n=1 Tax=Chitinophaga pinensis TaxID=79329 RepID=A0A5C6LMP4_9BACT|nr:hypothetical protein [Chitinophaga pinensis]TWV94688.1 hypothetical protein FEF09_25585 [Chitinophaga pinensis]